MQLLEGFFSQADIVIQPPGDGFESEEDSGDEFENDSNFENNSHQDSQDSIRINYGDGTTFDTLHHQTDESCEQSEEKENNPELEEVGNDSTGDDERADNHSLGNKLPKDVEFT